MVDALASCALNCNLNYIPRFHLSGLRLCIVEDPICPLTTAESEKIIANTEISKKLFCG